MVSRAKESHTVNRVFRMGDGDWEDLGTAAGAAGRSQVIRDLVRWYLRRPGAKLPVRPPREP